MTETTSITTTTIPIPSKTLLAKINNLPILTNVPTIYSFVFTLDQRQLIVCGWQQQKQHQKLGEITAGPVPLDVLVRFRNQCFGLLGVLGDDYDETVAVGGQMDEKKEKEDGVSMLRVDYKTGQELIIIPDHDEGYVFVAVVDKDQFS